VFGGMFGGCFKRKAVWILVETAGFFNNFENSKIDQSKLDDYHIGSSVNARKENTAISSDRITNGSWCQKILDILDVKTQKPTDLLTAFGNCYDKNILPYFGKALDDHFSMEVGSFLVGKFEKELYRGYLIKGFKKPFFG